MATNNAVNVGLSGATGTGNFVGSTSPTLTTPSLGTPSALVLTNATGDQLGTTTNDNAAAGHVGEFISSTIASGSAVTATSNTATDVTSISLTAGDWDVWGNINYATLGTNPTGCFAWTSATSATTPDKSLYNGVQISAATLAAGTGIGAPFHRYSLTTTTTIYLTGLLANTSGNGTFCGGIYARRAR